MSKVKILMTGFTSQQVKPVDRINTMYTGALAVYHGLKIAGYEVKTWDPQVDEVFMPEYDALVCGIYAIRGLGSHRAPFALAAVHTALNYGVPVIFYVDDWHIDLLNNQFRSYDERTIERLSRMFYKGALLDRILGDITSIRRWSLEMEDHLMARKVLLPVFGWTSDRQVRVLCESARWDRAQVVPYDPTFLLPRIGVSYNPAEKRRAWSLTTKYDYTWWVNELKTLAGSKWNIEIYGHKKMKDIGGHASIPELRLPHDVYSKVWGVLSHPYPEKLQGQWRNRYQFAAWSGCVIFGMGEEINGLNDDFNIPISQVESMSYDQLLDLSVRQSADLVFRSWSYDRAVEAIINAVGVKP